MEKTARIQARKYRAIETFTCIQQNVQLSPWFASAQECSDWMKKHGKRYDAIQPAVNWQECIKYDAQNGREIWPCFS